MALLHRRSKYWTAVLIARGIDRAWWGHVGSKHKVECDRIPIWPVGAWKVEWSGEDKQTRTNAVDGA